MQPIPARHYRTRSDSRRRRTIAAVVGLVVLLGAAVAVGLTVGGSSGKHRQALGGGTGGPGPSSTVGPTTTTTVPLPPPPSEPGGGRRLFPGRRIVAFYGAPGGGALGVLGATSAAGAWPALAAQAAPYAQPGRTVLPAFELIAYVAQGSAGPDGSYSARLPDSEIRQYLAVVRAHHGMLILDIQPGRGDFLADAHTLAPYLAQADVGLALDPEWEVAAPALPGQVIGHTTAAQIDGVGGWLDRFTAARRLPQKLLLVHQFTTAMIEDKPAVTGWYHLATVFNMDGFGNWANKVSEYHSLATDGRWHLGFKLFYRQDTPTYPPASVLALQPSPAVIDYE